MGLKAEGFGSIGFDGKFTMAGLHQAPFIEAQHLPLCTYLPKGLTAYGLTCPFQAVARISANFCAVTIPQRQSFA